MTDMLEQGGWEPRRCNDCEDLLGAGVGPTHMVGLSGLAS